MHFLRKLNLFTSKPKTLLGIDIDDRACRFVELSRTSEGYQMHACVQKFFDEENLSKPFDWNDDACSAYLQHIVLESNFLTKRIALALPHSRVLFKTMELDKTLQDSEIMIQIKEKITQYFNYPLADLLIDFEILGTSKNHIGLNEIQYVAAKLPEVVSRIKAFKAAQLKTVFVETDSHALKRAASFFLLRKYSDISLVVVMHVGVGHVLWLILEEQRVIHIGKETIPINPGDLKSFAQTIWQVFLKNNVGKLPQFILLCGLGISSEFLETLQSQTQIKTAVLDILAEFNSRVSHRQDLFNSEEGQTYRSEEFVIAAGLAMRAAI